MPGLRRGCGRGGTPAVGPTSAGLTGQGYLEGCDQERPGQE